MTTQTTQTEIAENEWLAFFNRFSEEHAGKLATLQTVDRYTVSGVIADHLPFVGISADLKDGEKNITITLGGQPDASLTHVISAPTAVAFDATVDAENPTLEIATQAGPTTRLLVQG